MAPGSQGQPHLSDRRRAQRYGIAIPIEIDRDGNGSTRDVSPSGVFFEVARPLAVGTPIRFSLLFDHVYEGLRLACEGQVVRVEQHAGTAGVAATITALRLDPDPKSGGSR